MTEFTIDEITIPATLEAPGAQDFVDALEVSRIVEEIGYGTPDLYYLPAEELPSFQNPVEPRRMLVARVDGRVVGNASYETVVDTDTGWMLVEVLPAHRNAGIGTALADAIEAMAVADGRTKFLVYTPIPNLPGERLPSPTGFGSIAITPDVTFLTARGYSLEQLRFLVQHFERAITITQEQAAAIAATE